jgi:nucleotide-binding universal stress UspA family protein
MHAPRILSAAIDATRTAPSATIHVLHVFRASRIDHARAGVPATPARVAEAREHLLETPIKAARDRCQSPIVGHFTLGEPTHEILKLCSELEADLLVVGTHDASGLERLLLGSISERLVRKAPCAVLVVRPREELPELDEAPGP